MHRRVTIAEGVDDLPWSPDVVVSRVGTATAAWGFADVIRTADDPLTPGDPQDPAHGAQETYFEPEDDLAIDAADVQTMVFQKTRRVTKNGLEVISDLVLSDRLAGDEWSTSPAEVPERIMWRSDLAVNASGAAAVVWSESARGGGAERLYGTFRRGSGTGWSAPERVPAPHAFSFDVGIDDGGRVLLVYDRIYDNQAGVWAVRRSPAGEWGEPQQLSGSDTELFGMTVGAGGAAVATYGHVDGDGRPDGRYFASRMSPSGTWGRPVRQPGSPGRGGAVDMDARGRTLLAGWDGDDLMGRWSRPNGRWRKPFVLAAELSKPDRWGLAWQVQVNRRGDAVVAWGAKDRVAQTWARYKPVGQAWTQPVRLTQADIPPHLLRTAIGECGHVAFAWVTGHGELQVLRASPTS